MAKKSVAAPTNLYESGLAEAIEAAGVAVRRLKAAAKKAPNENDPYWVGYTQGLVLACDHLAAMLYKAKRMEH